MRTCHQPSGCLFSPTSKIRRPRVNGRTGLASSSEWSPCGEQVPSGHRASPLHLRRLWLDNNRRLLALIVAHRHLRGRISALEIFGPARKMRIPSSCICRALKTQISDEQQLPPVPPLRMGVRPRRAPRCGWVLPTLTRVTHCRAPIDEVLQSDFARALTMPIVRTIRPPGEVC
jgi:hypothetical protein